MIPQEAIKDALTSESEYAGLSDRFMMSVDQEDLIFAEPRNESSLFYMNKRSPSTEKAAAGFMVRLPTLQETGLLLCNRSAGFSPYFPFPEEEDPVTFDPDLTLINNESNLSLEEEMMEELSYK